MCSCRQTHQDQSSVCLSATSFSSQPAWLQSLSLPDAGQGAWGQGCSLPDWNLPIPVELWGLWLIRLLSGLCLATGSSASGSIICEFGEEWVSVSCTVPFSGSLTWWMSEELESNCPTGFVQPSRYSREKSHAMNIRYCGIDLVFVQPFPELSLFLQRA